MGNHDQAGADSGPLPALPDPAGFAISSSQPATAELVAELERVQAELHQLGRRRYRDLQQYRRDRDILCVRLQGAEEELTQARNVLLVLERFVMPMMQQRAGELESIPEDLRGIDQVHELEMLRWAMQTMLDTDG